MKFTCKKEFNETKRKDISDERIFKNSNLNNTDNLLLMDFISKQTFCSYDSENGNYRRI